MSEDNVVDLFKDAFGDTPSRPPAPPQGGTGNDTDSDISFEVKLDPEPVGGVMPVDDGHGFLLPDEEGYAYPVIPEHLRSWEGVKGELGRHARRLGHRAAFHAVRSPWYLAQAVFWGAWGVVQLVVHQGSWWWLSEAGYLRSQAAASGDSREWMKIHKETKSTRRVRGIVLAIELFGLLFTVLMMVAFAHWWLWTAVICVVVPALAMVGRPEDRPILAIATTVPRFRVLNADTVLRAYYAAGLGHPDKPDMQVGFESIMARSADGEGSQVKVVLPYGKGFDHAVNAKDAIASGLDVAPSQVYLTRDKTSHRRHTLFVTDRDPLAIPAGRTPLLDCKPRNVWRPAPLGVDERNRKVSLTLLWISILIGAQPRKGKTFTARLLALYCALDPSVRISIVDGKKSPDWKKFALVAYHLIRGTVRDPREGDPVEQLLKALVQIRKHIDDVNNFLGNLPTDECPEGKLTEELCRKYPKDLFVWLLVMEEFQLYFELDDQDTNKEVAQLLAEIKAVGPSAGVILISSSQKPSGVGAGDVQRLFNRYRDNHDVRIALKCGNRLVSEAVLGGDAYSEGYDASALPVGDEYRGVYYLYGASDKTPTVRGHLADHPDAEKILLAARKYRQQAGTIAGYAAGHDVGIPARDVLGDVDAVFGIDPGLHWTLLADRLATRFPDRWADATPDAVSAQCRDLGVPSKDVKIGGQVLKGCRRADLMAARKGVAAQ